MNATNTNEPPPWGGVAVQTNIACGLLWHNVREWCAEWHLRNRRPLPPELVAALSAVSPRGYSAWAARNGGAGVVEGECTWREIATMHAAHIHRADRVVLQMIAACATGHGAAQVPEKLERVFWTLTGCRGCADAVAEIEAAHDAAMARLFNPEGTS